MKLFFAIFICSFLFVQSFGQTKRKVSTYLFTQYNQTVRDYTRGNNPWGAGFGLQAFFNNKTKLKPTLELTGDIYLADDKVLRLNRDGNLPKDDNSVSGIINLFGGASFQPTQIIYFSFTAGPSFIGNQTLLGIKPSLGFYFSKTQKWTGKISYITILNRTQGEAFGSVSLAIGLKLF